MTTVFAYHRVADYNFWRAGYARAIAATPEVRSYRIWRGQDDPNYVITAENFDSREVAERVWTSEETKTAMEADGIDMSTVIVEYVEEAGFGSGLNASLAILSSLNYGYEGWANRQSQWPLLIDFAPFAVY